MVEVWCWDALLITSFDFMAEQILLGSLNPLRLVDEVRQPKYPTSMTLEVGDTSSSTVQSKEYEKLQ